MGKIDFIALCLILCTTSFFVGKNIGIDEQDKWWSTGIINISTTKYGTFTVFRTKEDKGLQARKWLLENRGAKQVLISWVWDKKED